MCFEHTLPPAFSFYSFVSMPILKSAIKRVRVAQRRQKFNQVTKSKFREPVKQFIELIEAKNFKEAQNLFPQVQKMIDLAAKKHVLHKNTAARKKSSLAKMLEGAPATKIASTTEKKTATKTIKKTTTKK